MISEICLIYGINKLAKLDVRDNISTLSIFEIFIISFFFIVISERCYLTKKKKVQNSEIIYFTFKVFYYSSKSNTSFGKYPLKSLRKR